MFKPISCTPTSVQPGFRRFQGADSHPPLIKSWRCELSALSHAYNLYFIACNDVIYIYEPNFPSQELPAIRACLYPPNTPTSLRESELGIFRGIDPEDPHSITRLQIDYLGREEILTVTCDDGDVIVYRVPDIYRAVDDLMHQIVAENHSNLDDHEVNLGYDVRLLLHTNVGSSAWGISVHREARLIAISANTHRVTVFAYALSSESDESASEGSDFSSFSGSDGDGFYPILDHDADFPSPRRHNHRITLVADTNIPSINFDNNDPSGRWLFSSTISGKVHLWDLSKPLQSARLIAVGHCAGVQNPDVAPHLCLCVNRTSVPHAAWAALFIDPQSCHQTRSVQEACGPGVAFLGPKEVRPCFWDITESAPRFTSRRSGPFPSSWDQSNTTNTGDNEDLDSMILSSESEEDEDEIGGNEQGDPHSADQTSSESEEEHGTLPTQHPQSEPQSPMEVEAHSGETAVATNNLVSPVTAPYLSLTPIEDPIEDDSGSESDISDSETNQDLLSFITAVSQSSVPPYAPEPAQTSSKRPYCKFSTSTSFDDHAHEPRPCIIVTKEEIYLFQHPFDSAGDYLDPIIMMQNPLFPPVRGGTGPIPPHHRQCFTTQIPELGVFIVASPAGRAAIFSLTKFKGEDGRTLFGFRMDHILPSVKEGNETVITEAWGRRLVGVAVGPVQGMLDREQSDETEGGGQGAREERRTGTRRWRLMMHYIDHTVYSYDLGKYSGDGNPGLGDLVV